MIIDKEVETSKVEVQNLQKLIKSKDKEIDALKKTEIYTKIMQFDGIDSTNFTNDEVNDYVEICDEDSESQDNSCFRNLLSCEVCEFTTQHSSGLKIHFERCHKKCKECGKIISGQESPIRHNTAEKIINHSDWKAQIIQKS
jgi:hypothetical protein